MIEAPDSLYKGFVTVKAGTKSPTMKFKGVPSSELLTYDEIKDKDSYGGVLQDNTVMFDIDDEEMSNKLMDALEEKGVSCRVIATSRGMHFTMKQREDLVIEKHSTHTRLACGLVADIKCGSKAAVEVLTQDGHEREIIWDEINSKGGYDEFPVWMYPVSVDKEFVDMGEGDGRNEALFSYMATLMHRHFTKDQCIETAAVINNHVFSEPMTDEEFATVTRDGGFESIKPAFFDGKTFLHSVMASYLIDKLHIKRINGRINYYEGGVYRASTSYLCKQMELEVDSIKNHQEIEVLHRIDMQIDDNLDGCGDKDFIAFENGLYNIQTGDFRDFSPDIIVTNQIPHAYNPRAYSEDMDSMLDRITCHDQDVRDLLEECTGSMLYRSNQFRKSFLFTGGKRGGKSTYMDCLEKMIGKNNFEAVPLQDLADRFSTIRLYGKLANISDDIPSSFVNGNTASLFKKIVSGNEVKAEEKGEPVISFKPYCKLIFACNVIPRMSDDDSGAVKDRIAVIPFNAKFSVDDPDYDPYIEDKIMTEESMQYLINIGIRGLNRLLDHGGKYTEPAVVKAQMEQYEQINNPLMGFIAEYEDMLQQYWTCSDAYLAYRAYCEECQLKAMALPRFKQEIMKKTNATIGTTLSSNGRKMPTFMPKEKRE